MTASRRGRRGFIPAWAGETCGGLVKISLDTVHPRVGGGDVIADLRRAGVQGSSPRGRGRLPRAFSRLTLTGFIPAWAGETPRCGRISSMNRVHPRVGGGDSIGSTM